MPTYNHQVNEHKRGLVDTGSLKTEEGGLEERLGSTEPERLAGDQILSTRDKRIQLTARYQW